MLMLLELELGYGIVSLFIEIDKYFAPAYLPI